MKRTESGMTTEQLFQEAYLAEAYIASENPVFVERGQRILRSHDASAGLSSTEVKDSLVPDLDPRVIASKAFVQEERSFESYRQSGTWKMQAGKEYSPSEQ